MQAIMEVGVTEPTREAIILAAVWAAGVEGRWQGFFGAVARKGPAASDRELRAAWHALGAYRGGLEDAGIKYDELVPPEDLDAVSGKAPVEAVLEASGQSIIVVRNWTDGQIVQLRRWLGMGYLWSAMIVSLKDNQTIEMVSEKMMQDAGWIRISKAKKFVQEST